jgi:hypothetical protein
MPAKNESIFRWHIRDTLEKDEPKISSQVDLKMLPAGRLLNWMLNFWDEPTISVRDICKYGPEATRNHKSATALAEILTQRGWLIPISTHRHDRKVWKIIRETE